jgi:site-specific DNA-methyltransferase (adenine-specific)
MDEKTLILGDCVECLKTFPDECVNLILTDPAYESLEKYRAIGTTTRLSKSSSSSNDWFDIFHNERFPALLEQYFRVLKKNAHLYMFCDEDTSDIVKPLLQLAGFKVWKRIVWDKMAMGMGYHFRNQHEFILFAEKGKRKLNNLGVSSVLRYKRIVGGYPTEKPVELLKLLISMSTSPGDIVLDTFCGSGSSGEASLTTLRKYIGIDSSAFAIETARKRLFNDA